MKTISIFGNLSFALSALSFLMQDMSRLKLIAIVSAVFAIFYNYNVTESPLWLVIFWLSTFMTINLSMLVAEHIGTNPQNLTRTNRNYSKLFYLSSVPSNFFNFLTQAHGGQYAVEKGLLVRKKRTLYWLSFGGAKRKY